jgi:hypothetical protein
MRQKTAALRDFEPAYVSNQTQSPASPAAARPPASGPAAAPLRSVMNSRRLMWDMGLPPAQQ